MTLIRAVDLSGYWVMGYFRDICVTISAHNVSVYRVGVDVFVNIVNSLYPKFVDPTDLTIFVSH